MIMMAGAVVAEETLTFGKWLAKLRRREPVNAAARRIGFKLTSQYMERLEKQAEPGNMRAKTIRLLAEAYWEGNYPDVDTAFWDLWQRAGNPLPLGFPPALKDITTDPRRFAAFRRLLDTVGSWRTDEVEGLVEDMESKTDRELKRLQHPDIQPPITKLPGQH